MKSLARLIAISFTGCLFASPFAQAQFEPINGYAEEALLFSETHWNGSARILGFGGAQTALGGDISSVSANPAGLGFYNRSEFSFTPSLNFISTNTDYLGSSHSSGLANFNIGNLGLVINKPRKSPEGSVFLGGSFGFSYNRINDFHHEAYYSGVNSSNDFIDYVLGQIGTSYNNNDYIQGLSFDTYLVNDFAIDPTTKDTLNQWSTYVEDPRVHPPLQSEWIKSGGSQDQWSISYGANLSDRFYIGASLGLVSLNYKTQRQYKEVRYPQSILDNYVLNESLRISGGGVNGTFGAIVRPVDFVTFGITYTTPTLYQIDDEFNANMESFWRNSALAFYPNDNNFTGDQYSKWDPIVSKYTMRTASHLNAGAAVFIQKSGMITGDIEWTDYTSSRLSGGGIDFSGDNDYITRIYKPALNYRIGGEYRLDKYRIRAGYNYMGDPYNNVDKLNRSVSAISAGAGYRGKAFYTDLASVYSVYKSLTSPYTFNPTPIANIDNHRLSFILSVGFLF